MSLATTATTVQTIAGEIQADASAVLSLITSFDPALAGADATANAIVTLFAGIATKATSALAHAAATPITDATIASELTPDPTPLTPPTP